MSIIVEPLGLPDWTLLVVIILLSIGFIISIVFSWIYETSHEDGLEKTKPTHYNEGEIQAPGSSTWKIASFISFIVIIGLIVLNVIPRFPSTESDQELEKSIAVLPFENMSNDAEDAYFGDAMTDEIIMQLYKIDAFEVRSRTSVMQYKTSEKTTPTIGDELKVNYLIEGSAQRYNDQIRIRVQLIYAPTDTHIWGEVYEGSWEDILTVQSNIAQEVASELKTVLTTREIEEIEKPKTENLEAYEIYLKAQFFHNKRNKEGFIKSISLFKEAIRMDPEFTVAYAGLAYSLILMGIYDLVPMGEVLPEAREAVSMAFELDSELEEVYLSRALLEIVGENLPGAEKAYLKSFKLNAGNADSHHSYSYVLSWLGRHKEAIEEAKKALALEPINPVMTRGMGYVYYYARQFDLAIAEYKKSIEVDTNQLIAYQWLSWAYHSNRMYPEAINAIGEYLKILKRENLAVAIENTFDESGYIPAIRQLIDFSKQDYIPNLSGPYWNSILYALIGEIDEAFHSLERYTEEEYPWRVMNLDIFPYFDSISSDPRSPEVSRLSD